MGIGAILEPAFAQCLGVWSVDPLMRALVLIVASGCWSTSTPIANRSHAPRAVTPGPFAPVELVGPFASVDAYCADAARRANDAWRAESGEPPEEPLGCVRDAKVADFGPTLAGPSGGLMTAAELVVVDTAHDVNWGPECSIVIHVGGRVWAAEKAFACRVEGLGHTFEWIVIDEMAWHDVIDRAPEGTAIGAELVVKMTFTRYTGGGVMATGQDMVVCGIGASGKPRCTPAIPMRLEALSTVETSATISRTGMLRFAPRITHDEGTIDDGYMAKLRVTHQLDFP
jgi:hypothetical protein